MGPFRCTDTHEVVAQPSVYIDEQISVVIGERMTEQSNLAYQLLLGWL